MRTTQSARRPTTSAAPRTAASLAVGQQGTGVDANALSAGDVTIAIGTGQAVTVGAVGCRCRGRADDRQRVREGRGDQRCGYRGPDGDGRHDAGGSRATSRRGADYDLTINGVAIYTDYDASIDALTGSARASAINANSSATGVTATFDAAGNA